MMRYRVDTRFGYASFDESELAKAEELYEDQGVRLILCKDLMDEGVVLKGLPFGAPFKWLSA